MKSRANYNHSEPVRTYMQEPWITLYNDALEKSQMPHNLPDVVERNLL
jgi:hypothetical protein